jgi:predicted ATP-binding protein involved in virulence
MKGLDEHGNIRYGGKGKIDLTYQMRDKYTNTILLEQEVHALDVILKDDIESDGFVGLIDSNYFPNLVIAFTQGGHVRDYKFGNYEKHRGNIGDISALLFNTKQEYFEDLEQWIFNLDGDSSEDKRAKKILEFVFEVVSGVVGLSVTLERVEHQREEIWVRIDQDEPVLFKLVSQGFTKVFAWVGHFIKRLSETNPDLEEFKDAKAILIIDEIDTYLHPKWQRNILAFLAKTFTNTQFIVTTHSPLVANYINSKEVNGDVALYRLEKVNNSVKATRFDKIYGRDLSAIFYDWMGISERPEEVTHKIDKILALIDEETKESIGKAKELLQDLELEEHDVIMSEIQASLSYAEENIGE